MKKKVTLIARNNHGASVVYTGRSKAETLRNFKLKYFRKGWKIKYFNSYGVSI